MEYTALPHAITPEQLSEQLTLKVVEVERVVDQSQLLDGIVIGKVLSIEKHPDADKLNVCIVDIGETESVQVVCGGSNVWAGMLCAFGKIGAKVRWHGEGDLIELTPVKIRGVDSFGMICAADEIGLSTEFPKVTANDILDVTEQNYTIGIPLAKALQKTDVIIDVENKTMTHRPDLWGHYGMARECAALYNTSLKPYNPPPIPKGNRRKLVIDIQAPDVCTRASFVAIEQVHIEPSPAWIQEKLLAVGLRPINNIVDITNYIMYDLGQPMHAHDAQKITGDTMVIRYAQDGECLVTLDQRELALTKDMLVIADTQKAVALAGIMGGQASDIDASTTSIILEAANFEATNIRKTAQSVGIRTDASTRFEKSLDPYLTEKALRKAVDMIVSVCPNAVVSSNVADVFVEPVHVEPITISLEFIQKKIGTSDITGDYVTKTLQALGFTVSEQHSTYTVGVPSWRATKDIQMREDIVEEIARMYGFNNVPAVLPTFSITPPPENTLRNVSNEMKHILSLEAGCTEVYNYSFISPESIEKIGDSPLSYIELENPVAKDRPYIRRSLVPNILENIEKNQHEYATLRLFEIGKVFLSNEDGEYTDQTHTATLPKQQNNLAVALMAKEQDTPFYSMAQILSIVCHRFGIPYTIAKTQEGPTFAHPGRTATIIVEKNIVGYITEIHPAVQESLGIDERVAVCEINLDALVPCIKENISYKPLDQFPAIDRDIAIVVDRSVTHRALANTITQVSPLITKVELFDVYEGEHIEKGKKSMAYHITYRSSKKTLESAEVDAVQKKVMDILEKKYNAVLR